MATQDDPKGYYHSLGLAPNATHAQIAHAYREWAKTFHPDKTGSADASDFHRIKEAYDTLSDETRRLGYHLLGRGGKTHGLEPGAPNRPTWQSTTGSAHAPQPDPARAKAVRCSVCNTISAQPRYCVFYRVISAFAYCRVDQPRGAYCPRCAAARSFRWSLISGLLGWWSIDGLRKTPVALWRNFWFGDKPRRANANLLITQARYFLSIRSDALAQSCLQQATEFAEGKDAEILVALRQSVGLGPARRSRNEWAVFRHPGSYGYALPLLLVAATLLLYSPGRSVGSIHPRATVVAYPAGKPTTPALPPSQSPAGARTTRYVAAAPAATIWTVSGDRYVASGYLPQFTTVEVLGPASNPDFVTALLPNGQPAILSAAALASGDGAAAKLRLCQDPVQEPPHNGELLRHLRSGTNRATVTNTGPEDSVVKFRDPEGKIVISLFVSRKAQAVIMDFPDGSYHFEYATGSHWSRKCGLFEQGMSARRLSTVTTIARRETVEIKRGKRVTVTYPDAAELVIPPDPDGPGHPEPIDQEAFVQD